MDFLIIHSSKDTASMNIYENLLNSESFSFENADFEWNGKLVFKLERFLIDQNKNLCLNDVGIYLGLTDERLIFLDNLKLNKSVLNPDFLIFASRHTSKTARPALLTHTTGNWSENIEFGGQKLDISKSSALLHKAGFFSLIEQALIQSLENFVIDIEVTHHGPTSLEKPLVYMELGSSKKEWRDNIAGKIIAYAIVNTIFKYRKFKEESQDKVGLGFGGTHYAPNFNRLIRTKNIAMSFICPKYFIQNLDHKMVEKMIKNTYEDIDFFIIDWKGTNSDDKKHLIPILEEFEIPIKKTKDF
ncbi:MAG: D-aminoacyl-tRNA deacylase [Candidatus Odinarchaeota archaeon]